ncbi:reverse transcriptase domain-containing protein [Tanacetum coccineum]
MEELPHVLWAHRTMIKSSNGDTPFSLTYGTEAVILAEIGMSTLRTAEVDLVQNNEALEINLDLLEERREQAVIREAKSKAKMERYYNSKVYVREVYRVSDYLLSENSVVRDELRNCPKPRVQDLKYFMEKMLLAKQDEARVILTDEQNDFLFADASRMEEIEELSANICLMARIQPADNTSDTGPSYESAFISEV